MIIYLDLPDQADNQPYSDDTASYSKSNVNIIPPGSAIDKQTDNEKKQDIDYLNS